MRILLVEDDVALAAMLQRRLAAEGWTVGHAANVAEGQLRIQQERPDAMILDLHMPDGSGLDLVTELRSLGWNRLVVLASSDDPYAVRSAFQAGAQAYLLKSASPGLQSRVISASVCMSKRWCNASSTVATWSGRIKLGVPPPKKMLWTCSRPVY